MVKVHETAFIAPDADLVDKVEIGKDSSIWYHTVLRGDNAKITVGERTAIQDNSVVHCGVGFPVTIGNDVTVGHGAIIHGCTIDDNTLIGMGSIIMNGVHVGKNCIVAAGSLITQGKDIPDYSMVMGSPAKVVRSLTEAEVAKIARGAAQYVELKNIRKAELEGK